MPWRPRPVGPRTSWTRSSLDEGALAALHSGICADRRQVQNVAFMKSHEDPLLREWTKPRYNLEAAPR
ncbi:hypothetical protein PR202_ga18691 [Eleusine coracana subsp. coracana]|uniref:Uncharacterized protein n=1 Tax=Eleusine coracana subsp. coracana TaxID=191504 RepID=A0AAV5CTT7_ELECO|nr:hypothetical protein PR202_ga18691 [Eleusine coracana subsp. coracana]